MTPKQVKSEIEEYFNIADLATKERTRPLPQLRYLYFKICKTYDPKLALRVIGESVNRNHATVLWGLAKFHQEMKYHPEIMEYYQTRYNNGVVKDVQLLKGIIYV